MFKRIEKIVQARPQSAMDFLREHGKTTIDGGRRSDPRHGWLLIVDGAETWVADDIFKAEYREEGVIEPGLVNEIVTAGVRALTVRNHPDLGGNHDKMVAINAAATWLKDQARKAGR